MSLNIWPAEHTKRVSRCPHCGAGWRRCIYMGLPLRMCVSDGCNTIVGAGAWLCWSIPITTDGEFAFIAYPRRLSEGAMALALPRAGVIWTHPGWWLWTAPMRAN